MGGVCGGVCLFPGSRLGSKFWQDMQFSVADPLEMDLLQDVQRSMAGTREPSTMGGYARAFVRYQSWCGERIPPRDAVPARPETVALYLQEIANKAKTFSVVKTASGMIHTAHDLAWCRRSRTPRATGWWQLSGSLLSGGWVTGSRIGRSPSSGIS